MIGTLPALLPYSTRVSASEAQLPALISAAGERTERRFREFFAAAIRTATRTPAGPTAAPWASSWPGVKHAG